MEQNPSPQWTKSHFWIQPEEGFNRSTQGRSHLDFQKFETQHQCILPQGLKDLYHQQNGGYIYPRRFAFATNKIYGFVNDSKFLKLEDFVSLKKYVDSFMDDTEIQELSRSIFSKGDTEYSTEGLEQVFVISTFWGHSVLCLDYTSFGREPLTHEPRVRILEDSGASLDEFASVDSFDLFLKTISYGGDNFENDSTYIGVKTKDSKPFAHLIRLIEGTSGSKKTSASEGLFPLYLFEGVRANLTANRYTTGTRQFPHSESPYILCLDTEDRNTSSIRLVTDKIQQRLKHLKIESEILFLPENKSASPAKKFLHRPSTVPAPKRDRRPEHRYSLRWPRGWTQVDDLIMKLHLQFTVKPNITFKIHLAQLSEKIELKDAVNTNLENYKKIWQILWRRKVTLDPFEAELILLDQTIGSITTRQYKAFMTHKNDFIIATGSTPIDDFERFEKMFLHMIYSISPLS